MIKSACTTELIHGCTLMMLSVSWASAAAVRFCFVLTGVHTMANSTAVLILTTAMALYSVVPFFGILINTTANLIAERNI